MIARFFDKTVVVRRLRSTGVNNRTGFQATATVDGAIQELDRQKRTAMGIDQERAWIGYFDIETDINAGDHITRQDDGRTFKVIEATKKDYGINQHLEVMFTEYNA